MVDKDKMNKLLQGFRETDIDDEPALLEFLDKLVAALGSEDEAMEFLAGACDEDLIILGPIFEDLSFKFKSLEFITFLKRLSLQHPTAELDTEVMFAEKALNS